MNLSDLHPCCRMLPWDSDLFGFPVASISPAAVDEDRLPDAVATLRSAGVRLAYATVPWSDARGRQALEEAGARCVDRRVRFRGEARSDPVMPLDVATVRGGLCTPDLERLALASGAHSRFRVDARIPTGVFERLYLAWIRRSVAGEIAGDVLVIHDGPAAVGMVTVAVPAGETVGAIGLLAVDDAHRKRGLGRLLVRGAEAWCAAREATSIEVVTQRANAPACALYASCGHEVVGEDAVFHLWLEPPR